MAKSPYQTRSQSAANVPPPEATAAPSRCRWIIVWLHPRKVLAPEAIPPASLVSALIADPLASSVALALLEPLFLGMDDNTIVSSPPGSPPPVHVGTGLMGEDYSLASPPRDLYDVDVGCPPLDLTTPERQAVWEAELAHSPTPPPTADVVVDAVLASSRAVTLVFCLEVQPLMPPPRWVGCHTPPPPPPDHHLPTNGEISGWSERFVVADLVVRIVDGYFPHDWEVPSGSLPERCLQ
ncbi:related to Mig1 protein [Ustilago bromivora]|uniref:Related to Mig1 protein n=1 Tax=Ustilago bromivora TaxID=307758 RepID=A0A1K0H4U3_9BASI|nr:related to Mig1 protein [Ustilago bromivora]